MSKIENTCNPKCRFWKKYKQNCPFYLETKWDPHDGSQPYYAKDCSPKRSVLLTMELSNRLWGLQKEANEERSAQHKVLQVLSEVANAGIHTPIINVETVPLLEGLDEA